MPEISKPVPGNFCWVEANIENPEKEKAFYGELFGWTSEQFEISAGNQYTMFKVGERQVAGLLKLAEMAKKRGAPSHWLNYVAVDDVAAATKKVKKLGGTVYYGPESMGPGTMSVIADPTGAALALWQEGENRQGTFLFGEDNSLCWCELTTTDPAAAKKFYAGLFGWTTEAFPMGDFEYTVLKNGEQQVGGLMPQPKPMVEAKAPSLWTAYFAVADCDATVARAKKLGGKVFMPPTDIPNVGRFAIVADTDGAPFAVIKNLPRP